MHFDKYIDKGNYDPRCKNYYIYKCNICKNEVQYFWVPNFETSRLRKCPNCGVTNDVDQIEYLIGKKQKLEQQIATLQEEFRTISLLLEKASKEKEICKAQTLHNL
jgi:DNA-directed RNA polymerase subunit RPC12/RpoP